MKNLAQLITALKEFKTLARDLQRKYDTVSSVLIFPTIKKLVLDVKEFERNKYLDHIHGRSYQKLLTQLNAYNKDIKSCSRQLEMFLKSARDYVSEKYESKQGGAAGNGSFSMMGTASNIFSFDELMNVYDVFLNTNYSSTPALLYQTVLGEKIKRKRTRIAELNAEVSKRYTENCTRNFIEFLRKYDPYSKRLRLKRDVQSTREVPRSLILKELAFEGKAAKEHLMELISQKQDKLRDLGDGPALKRHLIAYYELSGHTLDLLRIEKREALQTLCNNEFHIMKAKKFVSILFEDNKEENDRLVQGLEQLKRDNVSIRVNIEKFKANFMRSLQY